ncbi:ubiquinone anaerobic biosynthesis accessory factor UbiT [Roseibium marinum]|nr:SCP2 sterol-binding domain-containing protein [Roseibium marinum]
MQDLRSNLSLPPVVSTFVEPLPRSPIEALLSVFTRRLVARRPDLLRRLGAIVHVPIAIVPDDMPHAFLLSLNADNSRVSICEKSEIDDAEAVIRAPFLVLLGLLDGTYDGDALFFSRDLRIEGRTEYVLALRNTLEEANLTSGEFFGLTGVSARWVDDITRSLLAQARSLASLSADWGNTASGQRS